MFLLIFVSCFLHCLDSLTLKHDIQLLDQRHELVNKFLKHHVSSQMKQHMVVLGFPFEEKTENLILIIRTMRVYTPLWKPLS